MLYSALMVCFPISTFYFSFYVLFKANMDMIGWSGILAVFAANIVIGAYVLMAWREDEEEQRLEQQQKEKIHQQIEKPKTL
jgi:vacuolar ATPase assembly integral membrane protein VMA21